MWNPRGPSCPRSVNRFVGRKVTDESTIGWLGDREVSNVSVSVLSPADGGPGPDEKVLRAVGGILGGSELAAAGAVMDCRQLKLWARR